MAEQLADRGIRVNQVAPGPVWPPFIPGSMPPEEVESFGEHVPRGRPAQPQDVATAYLFFASPEGSYYTGQTPNGGAIASA